MGLFGLGKKNRYELNLQAIKFSLAGVSRHNQIRLMKFYQSSSHYNQIYKSSDSKIFISDTAKFIAIDPSLNFTNGKS
nr:hypothetical protein [uncultured Campylobacter sp.]